MPYDQIRTNIMPSNAQKLALTDAGAMDLETQDWTGSDFATSGRNGLRGPAAAGMFFYPLPLDYNPYQPSTQGYNNTMGAGHSSPTIPWVRPTAMSISLTARPRQTTSTSQLASICGSPSATTA